MMAPPGCASIVTLRLVRTSGASEYGVRVCLSETVSPSATAARASATVRQTPPLQPAAAPWSTVSVAAEADGGRAQHRPGDGDEQADPSEHSRHRTSGIGS